MTRLRQRMLEDMQIHSLPAMAQAMAGLAILSGLRRGELFALRWRDIDHAGQRLTVRESVYDGQFGTPKTEAGVREIPLSTAALELMSEWKRRAERTDEDDLLFGTRAGGPQVLDGSVRDAVEGRESIERD